MPFRFSRVIAVLLIAAAVSHADSVRTLDGKIIDGTVKIDPKGGLVITPRGAQPPQHVDFNQLLRVRLDSVGLVTDTNTTDYWGGSDIGATSQPGSNKLANGALSVEAGGADIKGKADSFRLVSQNLTGTGEVLGRLTASTLSKPSTLAGVMIRTSTDSDSPFAALLMAKDSGLQFVVRGKAGDDARVIAVSPDRAPIWLRLARGERSINAYKSTDGKMWTRVGESVMDLGNDVLAGVAVASRDPAATTIVVFDKLRVSADEPTGSEVTPLTDVPSIVTKVKRDKEKDKEKAAMMNTVLINTSLIQRWLTEGTSCEVRYALNGKQNLLVGNVILADRDKGGGSAIFQIFADNEKLFDSGKMNASSAAQPFNLLITGRKELRLLVIDGGENGKYNSVEFRQMRVVKLPAVRPSVKTQTSSIVTVGGSVYSGSEVRNLTADVLQFSRGERRDLSIPATQVARIYMPGLTQQAIDHLPTGTGVLMTNGDFYEGDIDRVADGKIQVNSVIFGPREFTLRRDVAALVLHTPPTDLKAPDYLVQTNDGSVFMADSMAGDGAKLTITDHTIGKMQVDLRNVREIRYGGDRLKWLADLRPRRVDNDPTRSSADSFMVDATTFGQSLQLTGVDCDRGVSLAAGTSVTYDLDGQYKALLCVAGIPADAMPTTSAVFVVEGDGKELFRSPARNSVQDALPVAIDATGLKTITLRVEGDKGAILPTVGLWGDPLLVKTAP